MHEEKLELCGRKIILGIPMSKSACYLTRCLDNISFNLKGFCVGFICGVCYLDHTQTQSHTSKPGQQPAGEKGKFSFSLSQKIVEAEGVSGKYKSS